MPEQTVTDALEHARVRTRDRSATHLQWFATRVRSAWGEPMVRRGTYGMTLVGIGSLTPAFLPTFLPAHDPLANQLESVAWMSSGLGRFAATVLLVAGMVLLIDAWLRLRPRKGGAPVPSFAWVLWSLPVLLAPPLFSRDAYSYAAQGRIVLEGYDPYSIGPAVVPGPYADQVDPMWLYTPAPYGPLALQLQHFIVSLCGDNAYIAAVAMRVPAVLAVALLAYSLPRLARRFGVGRDQALWLGVLNPLVIMHFVGGAHGDAIMVGLMAFGLLLASRSRYLLACVTIATAASIKQTAALALIGVVGMWLHAHPGLKAGTVARVVAVCGAVSAGAFAAITALTGLGWGWIPNLSVPVSLRSLVSPPTFLGSGLELFLSSAGMPDSWTDNAVPAVQGLGAALGVAGIGFIAWRYAHRAPVLATAGALLTFVATSPVVHPWYLLWGGVLLGATRLSDRVVDAVVWVTLFFVTYGIVDATLSNGTWALGVSAAVWLLVRMRTRRQVSSDVPRAGLTVPVATP